MPNVRAIFNPRAAGGRGARSESALKSCLASAARDANVTLDWVETQRRGHAVTLAENAVADGCELVVSIGGDGTANEVVNGLMRAGARPESTSLGLIPAGSGNDFAWFAGIPLDTTSACKRLFDGRTRVIDIGHIRDANGRERYFNNGCGAGFDAQVALEVERFKRLPGILVYFVPLLRTVILHHKAPRLEIHLDDKKLTLNSMLVTVGNGRRLGKGFLVTPQAELDDGLFDICIGGQLSRLGILTVIPRFMRGTHVTHNQVQMARSRHVTVESLTALPVHLDGEIFATDVHRLEISLIPGGLRVRV